jgi:hypothetical protein
MEAAGLVYEGNARASLTVSSHTLTRIKFSISDVIFCRVVLGHGPPRSHHESLEGQWIN